jgi:hypothetical protein
MQNLHAKTDNLELQHIHHTLALFAAGAERQCHLRLLESSTAGKVLHYFQPHIANEDLEIFEVFCGSPEQRNSASRKRAVGHGPEAIGAGDFCRNRLLGEGAG